MIFMFYYHVESRLALQNFFILGEEEMERKISKQELEELKLGNKVVFEELYPGKGKGFIPSKEKGFYNYNSGSECWKLNGKRLTNRDVSNDVFKNTYWGGFSYRPEEEEIYDNRIKFLNEYKIVKRAREIPQYIWQWAHYGRIGTSHREHVSPNSLLDHQEEYLDEDGNLVFVFSPYGQDINTYCRRKETISLVQSVGWDLLPYKFYDTMALTFVLKVEKGKVKNWINEEKRKRDNGLENNLYSWGNRIKFI